MKEMNRREFLQLSGAALAGLLLPRFPVLAAPGRDPAPASLGRIAAWWRNALRKEASAKSERLAWKNRDEIIPLYAAVVGEAPWPSNPIWYQTEGGYIHSGYVQPVENTPSSEALTEVPAPGFWAQVCVPIAEARRTPKATYATFKLYYGTVYRVVNAVADDEGKIWYQLQEGLTYSPGFYVPASTLRRLLPEEIAPISPGRTDKLIKIDIAKQELTCLEGDNPVFKARIAAGSVYPTPRGEFRILYKRHAQRMIGGEGSDHYDLPGIAFPTYFTWSGVAIHGTYWHNDFGQRHSHGCVNVTSEDAKWVFRWTEPSVPYSEYTLQVKPGEGTRVLVS